MTAETARTRNRRLYGRSRVPRSHRRVMLALLTGAPELGVTELARLAQCGFMPVIRVTSFMRAGGWAVCEPFGEFHRAGWRLTGKGRACVTLLLGLPAEEASHG